MMSKSQVLLLLAVATLSLFLAVPLHASTAAGVSVPLPNWDGPQAAGGWSYSDSTLLTTISPTAGQSYLAISSPVNRTNGASFATLDLPLSAIKGGLIVVRAEVRAVQVSQPAHSFNGVKVMVHVSSRTNADSWDQAAANGDGVFPVSYDWKVVSFQTVVPLDATVATLVLGLQESTGEVDIRNLSVTVTHPQRAVVKKSGPVYFGHGPGSLRGVMISPEIQPSDVATLAQWHVNLVRWQLDDDSWPQPLADTENAAAYDAWLYRSLEHLDLLLPYFKQAGIMVVLDLHTPPGGMDASNIHRVFTDPAWEQHYIDLWAMMATKYRQEPQIWGYDLLNEPATPGDGSGVISWHDLASKTARRIRSIDPYHALIVEPDPGGGVDKLAYFEPINVPGVVYSVHMYDPGQFTTQGVFDSSATTNSYPGQIGGQLWDQQRIRKEFQPVVEFARNNHAQIYVGEFSAVRWAPGADRYLADVISVMEENHWDWSYHAFREWEGWSLEIGEDKAAETVAATPTARLLVLQAAFSKNSSATINRRLLFVPRR